jgi:hypothetical protein
MARQIEKHTHPVHKRLYIILRSDSKWFQARASVGKRRQQASLNTQHLPTAFRLAEDWYRRALRVAAGEESRKDPLDIPIMEELFERWKLELEGKRREWVEMKWGPIARFWEAKPVTEITALTFKEFFRWRRQQPNPPKNTTLHQDTILIRRILKYAVEEGHLPVLPPIPSVGAKPANPRPWLTETEWNELKALAERRIGEARHNPRLLKQRQELLHQMVWMVETMMRVDEMRELRFRNCRVERNTQRIKILICEVQGKRGIRTSIGRRAAAVIYERRAKTAQPEDVIFPVHHREAFTELLKAANLHVDARSGFTRNFKSLRCTAISFAVLRGTDLLWIARNAGTSVAMIDSFYARRLSAVMAKDALTESRQSP